MSAAPSRDNVHATAIVVGTSGFLFMGPSGSGKSRRAFGCLAEAAARGLFAALVADDQVFVSACGGAIVAAAPGPIAGLIELRGSGIVGMRHLSRAVMHVAVVVGDAGPRLPEAGERLAVRRVGFLPSVRLADGGAGLAALAALCPQFLRI